MIDIDYIAIPSLPSRDRDRAAGGHQHRRAVGGIDILTFVIFKAAASEWISAWAQPSLEFSADGPDRRRHAATTQQFFIGVHLTFETFSFCYQNGQRRGTVNRTRGSALASRWWSVFLYAGHFG